MARYIVEVQVVLEAENADDAMDKVEAAMYHQYSAYEVLSAWRETAGMLWKD